jgi:hypothetical protein
MSTFSALAPEAPVKLLAVMSLLVALPACAPKAEESAESEAPAVAEVPRVELRGPDGPSLAGDSLTVRFTAYGVTIVPATGTAVAGEGHHHLFIDRDPTPDGEVIPKGDGIVHLGSGADSVRLMLDAGTHRLIAVLASGDHVPVAGAGRDTLELVVTPRP